MKMDERRLKLLADTIAVASVVFLALWALFLLLNDFRETSAADRIANAFAYFTFSAVGLLIIRQQPRNLIGWICAIFAFFYFFTNFADAYAIYAYLINPGAVPLREVAASIPAMFWVVPTLMPPLLLPALFPDGKPLSKRWGYFAQAGFGFLVVIALASTFVQGDTTPVYPNPTAIEAVEPVVAGIGTVAVVGWATCFLTCVVSAFMRFRRSSGQLRLQLKWFAFALLLALILASGNERLGNSEENILFGIGLTLIAVSIGVAVLRYHLYDIDRIVNRTLVYGLLTAGLALTYVTLVVGLQALLRPLSGGSDFAIVATTLIVAALFLPARRRLQDIVDRRFNRRAYDAARTIDAFSARLREQIDLDTLRYELLAVVDETMQPVRASLWLSGERSR
jgi:hypothetical protein